VCENELAIVMNYQFLAIIYVLSLHRFLNFHSISFTLQQKEILTQRSNEAMNCIGNLKKNSHISLISIAKPKNIVVFLFTKN
jgi:hypothetical protein